MHEIVGLFPTPFMRAPGAVGSGLASALAAHFSAQADTANNSSPNLSHTAMLSPSDSPLLVQAATLITPLLAEFGALLFGEKLGWSIKEMWVNVLDTGYLTPTHPDSRTVFMKSPGGTDFAFKNDHAGVVTGPYNADKWISMPPAPGDIVLFPSYLMHAVPPNPGERRITLAFNAIPTRLDSWGYKVFFSG
jgi:hypothetical protein